MYYDKRKMIDWGYSQIGYHEKASNSQLEDFTANAGDQNWNKYAAHLDTLKGFYNGPKNIGPNGMWCDSWYDDGMVICYGREAAQYLLCQPDYSAGAGCRFSAEYYQAKGRFFKSNPETGDQIFFGTGWDNVYHTGLVVKIENGIVYTIEGNTSDMVAERHYPLNSPKIFGYGRPRWGTPDSGATDTNVGGKDNNVPTTQTPQKPSEEPRKYMYSVQLPLLQIGDKGPYVKMVQTLLIARGYDCGNRPLLGIGTEKADGDFGQATERAVAKFQDTHGLEKDGEVGGATYAALFKFD